MADDKGNVVQNLLPVDGLTEAFNREHFIADLTLRAEVNIRIFAAGRADIIQFDLL